MRALVLLALSLALVACDPAYGVRRHAYVGHMPDPSKIRNIVQNTPGVDKVTYRHHHGGFPPTTEDYFDYRGGSEVGGSLLFSIDSPNVLSTRSPVCRYSSRRLNNTLRPRYRS